MKKMLLGILFLGLSCTVTTAYGDEPVLAEPGKWKKAVNEISEAAHAVGDATVDSSKKAWDATKEGSEKAWDATKEESLEAWDATKEGSEKAWDATKEKSQSAWEKGKAKLHDATTPESAETPKGD